MPVLLERHEQRHQEIHCQLHTLPEGKSKSSSLPSTNDEILECPFDKITIDLVTKCKTSTSGNKHILTIIDHLTSWPEAFPIPDKSSDIIVSTFIYQFTCDLDSSSQTMKQNLKIISWTKFFKNCIFPQPYHPQSIGKYEVFSKYLKPIL